MLAMQRALSCRPSEGGVNKQKYQYCMIIFRPLHQQVVFTTMAASQKERRRDHQAQI